MPGNIFHPALLLCTSDSVVRELNATKYESYSFCYFNEKNAVVDRKQPICILAEKTGNHMRGGNIAFTDGCAIFTIDPEYTPGKYLGKAREQTQALMEE